MGEVGAVGKPSLEHELVLKEECSVDKQTGGRTFHHILSVLLTLILLPFCDFQVDGNRCTQQDGYVD